jgi:dipeptidase D
MSVLKGLKPAPVWHYFEEICKIPRLSKNEEKIRYYLLGFARKNKLKVKEDSTGNILITRPSHTGFTDRKTVVLQSHMDMVGEKNADHPHDWSKDPIIPSVNQGWVTSNGTTLGADNGFGIASQLAILSDKSLKAGEIECLFTVDEESGMTGAKNLKPGFFNGRILLNLDSEDEGILFIGCAGGLDTIGTMSFRREEVPRGSAAFKISVTGLHGGHSGDEIHKGYGNSVKIMTRILHDLNERYGILLSHFDGGNLRNAIPREAFATIVVKKTLSSNIESRVNELQDIIRKEFGDPEKDLLISSAKCSLSSFVTDRRSQENLSELLACCPHGVIAWSKDMDDLVETSTNLASVKFQEGDIIKIVTTQRSSVESSKRDAAAMVESCMKLAGAEVTHSEGYPGWTPDINSEILKITSQSYSKLFGKDPAVKAIHAGLECGLIYEKFRGIDMISFGPTIRGAHTPEEKIEIMTAAMFWGLLVDVISNIPLKGNA